MNRYIVAITLSGVSLLLVPVTPSYVRAQSSERSPESVRVLIDHADTLYWFAFDGRSMGAANKALSYLARAEARLDQAEEMFAGGDTIAARSLAFGPDSETETETDAGELGAGLRGLRRELIAMRESDLRSRMRQMGDMHYGFFPLSRLIRPTLFSSPRATGLMP